MHSRFGWNRSSVLPKIENFHYWKQIISSLYVIRIDRSIFECCRLHAESLAFLENHEYDIAWLVFDRFANVTTFYRTHRSFHVTIFPVHGLIHKHILVIYGATERLLREQNIYITYVRTNSQWMMRKHETFSMSHASFGVWQVCGNMPSPTPFYSTYISHTQYTRYTELLRHIHWQWPRSPSPHRSSVVDFDGTWNFPIAQMFFRSFESVSWQSGEINRLIESIFSHLFCEKRLYSQKNANFHRSRRRCRYREQVTFAYKESAVAFWSEFFFNWKAKKNPAKLFDCGCDDGVVGDACD